MNIQIQTRLLKKLLIPIIIFICVITYVPVMAQGHPENPPKPIKITVRTNRNLSFGSFIQSGSNGTVTVTAQGARSATGSVILPNTSSIVTSALFDVEARPNTIITILNGPDVQLSGSSGETITLHLGDSDPHSPFIIPPGGTKEVTIGGTLTIGSLKDNPAGDYGGSFTVYFIQE